MKKNEFYFKQIKIYEENGEEVFKKYIECEMSIRCYTSNE